MFSQLSAQIAIDALRDSKKTIAAPQEGNTNVSLGAASAVFGSIGLLLGLLLAPIAVRDSSADGTSFVALAILAILGLGCSCVGFIFGRTAPRVTHRRPGMAKYGVVVSSIGLVLTVVSLVVTAANYFL